MPLALFHIAAKPRVERRQNRQTRAWFKVWTVERVNDDALPISDSLAGYETSNPWIAAICDQAFERGKAIEVEWRDGPYFRIICKIREVEKVSAA